MRRVAILAIAASLAVVTACGSDDDEPATAVPEDTGSETTGEAVPIVGSYWALSQLDTADATVEAPGDVQVYLQIDEAGEVTGSTGCNGFGGSAEVGDGVITFQPLIATRRGCSGELGQIDSAMLGVLRGEVTAEVAGDVLTITNADGATLMLQASDEPPSSL